MINSKDKKVLKKQLGREPRSVKEVIKRCQLDYPQVIVTEPILDSNNKSGIFPTSLWLTCPELNYRIGQLETKGLVQEIQNKIKNNQKLSKKLNQSHENYAK